MLSESELRAERISQEITRHSNERGLSEHQVEYVAFILLVALILHDENRTRSYLPVNHAEELSELVRNVFEHGDPDRTAQQFKEINHLLSEAMFVSECDMPSGPGILALAVRHIAGMLAYELEDLDELGRRIVADRLFYRLFARLVPSHQWHHELVAKLATPLADMNGGVLEVQPGPGEVFVASGMPDRVFSGHENLGSTYSGELGNSLRFIRNLRLAVHDIGFESNAPTRTWDLSLLDTTCGFNRNAHGSTPVVYHDENILDELASLRRQVGSPMLVIVGGKNRRPFKQSTDARARLVEQGGLRTVVDFHSSNGRAQVTLSLWYFGPAFPEVQDQIVHVDARHLSQGSRTQEALSCGALVGVLLRCLAEGKSLSKSRFESTGAPQRIINFIEEALSKGIRSIPGFIRLVPRGEMSERDFSLRAEDYVGKKEDEEWRPEVEIKPILSYLLRGDSKSTAVYLIGNNGAGKSLAMRDMAMALALEARPSFGISFGTTDRFVRSPRLEPLKSQFTYAGARTFSSGPNFRRSLGELGDMVKDVYDAPDRLRCFEAALDTLGFRPRQFLVPVGMSSPSDHWERLIADVHPLSSLSNTQQEQRDLKKWRSLPAGSYKLALMRQESPEILVFDSLSSGEQQILTMVIKIVANVQRNVVVLLDEPEISLHVAWQRQLPEILRKFSRELGCSFVVATHSPVVIASASELSDHCFVMHDRRLQELKPVQRRSVEASLFEGFNTYTPYTHHIQERCAEIVSRVIGEADDDGIVSGNEAALLEELKSLKIKLGNTRRQEAEQDIALVDKAIVAVENILEL